MTSAKLAVMCTASSVVPMGNCSVRVIAGPAGIQAVELDPGGDASCTRDDAHPLIREAVRQLEAYFAGRLYNFDLPLDMIGTEFQKRVWRALLTIPYGETRSYAAMAESIGAPRAVRAVGAANGRNPIGIVVPCHRVIGSSGKLVGYGGGLPLKRLLLDLEARHRERSLRRAAGAENGD